MVRSYVKHGMTDLIAYWRESEHEYYEERAAILEYDGGMNRSEAERQARKETDKWILNPHKATE